MGIRMRLVIYLMLRILRGEVTVRVGRLLAKSAKQLKNASRFDREVVADVEF
jgi:hypothetical protein